MSKTQAQRKCLAEVAVHLRVNPFSLAKSGVKRMAYVKTWIVAHYNAKVEGFCQLKKPIEIQLIQLDSCIYNFVDRSFV